MTDRKDDKGIRSQTRRSTDARGGRPTQRVFRPLRWAWLLLLVALLAPAYDLFLPAGWKPAAERHTVVIERGQSLHEIARELQRVGIIRSQVGFLLLARGMHLDRSVKAGQYSFRLGMTVPALLRALDRGMYGLDLVTIPEGLMINEAAALIEREVGISAAELDSLSRDPALLDSLGIAAPSLEGWLAPDSYEWLPGTAPDVVLRTMVTRTRERVQRATAGYDSLPLGMNAHEVLTLASIVESESRAKEERPRIARVYLNRLDRGMLLQADPTVGYALGRGPRSRLTFKDLRVVSPYNTYRHEGLPPGPICSPGEAAIVAVMNATPDTKDLYFVARGEGRHLFAPSYEEHLANIAYVKGKMAAAAARRNADAASADAEPDSGAAPGSAPGAAPGSAPLSPARRAVTSVPSAPLAATPNGEKPAPLKGILLISRSNIRTASTPPPVAVPAPAPAPAPALHADSVAKAPAKAAASEKPLVEKPTTEKPTVAKPATDKPAAGTPALKPTVAEKAPATGGTAKSAVKPKGKPAPRPAKPDSASQH